MPNTTTKSDRPAYMAEYVTKAELKTALKTQTIEIAGLITDMGDRIAEQITPVQADIKELKADVKVLKSDVKDLKADVTDLKTDVSELKTDMRTVKLTLVNQATAMGRMSYTLEGIVAHHPYPGLG